MHTRGLVYLLVFWLGGCNQCSRSAVPTEEGDNTATMKTGTDDTAKLIARGRAVYMSNCTACHSNDPAKAGNLGPDVAHSSRELLEARLLKAQYPEGYQPKRPNSKAMAPMPYLKNDLNALHAFLNQ